METHIIINWSISIIVLLSLVGYFYFRNRRREKYIYSDLHALARENNSTITRSDHWSNTQVGVDESENNKLFFIRTANNQSIREVISLPEVKDCRLAKAERTVTDNKMKILVIERVELIFHFADAKKPEVALEFYNNDYDALTIRDELLLAKKWQGIVNDFIVSNRNRRKVTEKARIQPAAPLKQPLIPTGTNPDVKRKSRRQSSIYS